MTSVNANSANSEPIYFGGVLPEVVKMGKSNKDIEIFPQKTNFSGDKNANGYVDISDLNEDEVKLFEEKGLIGKSWDYVKEHFGKLFGIKSTSITISNNLDRNSMTSNITLDIDENGDVININSVKNPTKDISGSTEKQENIKYDEYGNVVSFVRRYTSNQDPDAPIAPERISEVKYDNIYNDKGELTQRYSVNGPFVIQETYDYDENVKIVKIGHFDDETGEFKSTDKGKIQPLELKQTQ